MLHFSENHYNIDCYIKQDEKCYNRSNFVTAKIYRDMIYRCFSKTYGEIPFQVRSLGHYNITPEQVECKTKRNFIELYWCIDGEGEFNIDGEKYRLHPGEVCFYTYGDLHDLHAATHYFHYRWLAFDGPQADSIWKTMRLTKTPRFAGPCPEELYCRLEREILDYSANGLRKASATAFSILMLSASSGKSPGNNYGYLEKARQIIDENFNDVSFNINSLSEQLQINRSQLSRKFSSTYGIGLAQYLINRRIQHGISLITDTAMTVKDIAVKSGFADSSYFSRCIHKYSGLTITQLRNSAPSDSCTH